MFRAGPAWGLGCWDGAGTRETTLPPSLGPGVPSAKEGREGARAAWGARRRGTRTDLQLPLDPVLAAVPVLGLGRVIFGHDFHELPGECGVLGWGYTYQEAGSTHRARG